VNPGAENTIPMDEKQGLNIECAGKMDRVVSDVGAKEELSKETKKVLALEGMSTHIVAPGDFQRVVTVNVPIRRRRKLGWMSLNKIFCVNE
jgi:hypothetical protein